MNKFYEIYKSIGEVNIGGLPFLPNATDLVEQFVEHLIEKSPEEIQEEGILPKGTKAEWLSALDEKVLVGVVSTREQYQACIQNSSFSIVSSQLKMGWQRASYVALYVSKETGLENGVTKYGKIATVESKGNKVEFVVDVWEDLKPIIKPVNYGIAVYALTTLNTLKAAKELPELFMKSKEEIMIWRMLRRVSDQVKVDLDSRQIDQATRVESFKFKDIEIRVNYQTRDIKIKRGDSLNLISSDVLVRQPTSVFKLILKVLEG